MISFPGLREESKASGNISCRAYTPGRAMEARLTKGAEHCTVNHYTSTGKGYIIPTFNEEQPDFFER
jgi:hypothetical protein